jgi:hypothetical protein
MQARGLRWVADLDPERVLVRADAQAIAAWPDAIAATPLTADRKAPAELTPILMGASPLARGPSAKYLLIPSERRAETRHRIGMLVADLGGSAQFVEGRGFVMRVTLDEWGVSQLVESPDVLWIEPASAPEDDGDFSREFSGANYIELVEGFTGVGIVCEVMDSGLRTSHLDFQSQPPTLRTANSSANEHGTSSYGVVFGDGSGDPNALGMLPGATPLFSSYYEVNDREAHLASLVGPPHHGVLQSNSWGSGITRRYSAASAELDDAIHRHGVVIVQSQSNAGSPDSRPEAWSKNLISVGGVRGRGTLDRADDAWEGVASTGPALDSRVKPDLVMFNDGVWTTAATADDGYRAFTGTSAATPAVAGLLGLAMEMWREGLFDGSLNFGSQGGVDPEPRGGDGLPSVAMTKALLVSSARPYAFSHIADDLGRYRQGWGTPDLHRLHDGIGRTFVNDEKVRLVEGEVWTVTLAVPPGEPDLRVTLAYTDLPGVPLATIALVNDLDLRVISPTGAIYHGNHGLLEGVWSRPGGEPDRVNNIENVFVEDPTPGSWTIEITAARVLQDAWADTPEFDTPFAVVARGVLPDTSRVLIPVGPIPTEISPYSETQFTVEAVGFVPTGDGVMLVKRGVVESAVPLRHDGQGRYTATLAGVTCGESVGVRFRAPTSLGNAYFPEGADGEWIFIDAKAETEVEPSLETGWAASTSGGVTTGAWQHGLPSGGGMRWDPPIDADGDNACWLTDNRAGNSDVSHGTAILESPIFDLLGSVEPRLEVAVWLACDDAGRAGEDSLLVEYSTDAGLTWSPLAEERSTFRWVHRAYPLPADAEASRAVRFRFVVSDAPEDSITEAAVDSLRVVSNACGWCAADFNGDHLLDLADLIEFANAFVATDTIADYEQDGDVDLLDLLYFLAAFDAGCD